MSVERHSSSVERHYLLTLCNIGFFTDLHSILLSLSPKSSHKSKQNSQSMQVPDKTHWDSKNTNKTRKHNDIVVKNRTEVSVGKSEANKLVDRIYFGELCNAFECTSSPQVESTARQLARDILELRGENRAFACYAVSVRYKTIQEMVMLSTSILRISWKIKGKLKSILAPVSGDLIINVKSKFTLNQISGQVIEHEESWDTTSSSPIAQAYFWAS